MILGRKHSFRMECDISRGFLVEVLYQVEDVPFSSKFQRYFFTEVEENNSYGATLSHLNHMFLLQRKSDLLVLQGLFHLTGETVVPASCPLPIAFIFI